MIFVDLLLEIWNVIHPVLGFLNEKFLIIFIGLFFSLPFA